MKVKRMPTDPHLISMSELNGLTYSIRASGDGFEILDTDGRVVAWTLDKKWAWRILVALELFNDSLEGKKND